MSMVRGIRGRLGVPFGDGMDDADMCDREKCRNVHIIFTTLYPSYDYYARKFIRVDSNM